MTQYGRGETVYRAARTRSGNGGLVHRDLDCSLIATSGVSMDNLLEKPLPSLPEWVPRCPECF